MREAAKLAGKILAGTPVDEVPIMRESPNAWLFDYAQMSRFGIKASDLPHGSSVANQPESFYQKYKNIIMVIIGIFVTLAGIIITMSINIGQRKRAQRELELQKISLEEMLEKRKAELENLKKQSA